MPGRIERSIKNHLIHAYSRKRYYEYHNGTRPLTPDVERYVREVIKSYGWFTRFFVFCSFISFFWFTFAHII